MRRVRTDNRRMRYLKPLLVLVGVVWASVGHAESILDSVLAKWSGPALTGLFVNASSNVSPITTGTGFDAAMVEIDGSITNIIYGARSAVGSDITTSAFNALGSIGVFDATSINATGIGGVTTGLIELTPAEAMFPGISSGLNSALQVAASATSAAQSARSDLVGGSEDAASLSLNIASNAVTVRGDVDTVLTRVNAVVGRVRATGIGAVNTGTIQSGVEDLVFDLVARPTS
jgi:hypothetical protein